MAKPSGTWAQRGMLPKWSGTYFLLPSKCMEGIWGSSKPIPTVSLISWAPAGCKMRVPSLTALWRAKLCYVPWMADSCGVTDRGGEGRSPLGSGEGH